MVFARSLITVACLSLLAACGYTPGPVSTALGPDDNGPIWLTSSDAYDFSGYATAPSIVIEGDFAVPENHNGAAAILSHGSGGRGAHHARWAAFLRENGYATLTLDHFAPRSVLSTIHGQVRVTEQQMAVDILKSAALLGTHPQIAPGRVYHMGWSKGATAGVLASTTFVQRIVNGRAAPAIAGFVEFYPYCDLRGAMKSTAPVLILHGTADDYTLLDFCEALVDDMQAAGSDIRIERFDGALHGFDYWTTATGSFNGVTIRDQSDDCVLAVDTVNASTQSVNGNHRVDTYSARVDFLKACATRGVSTGGSPQYRERTEELVLRSLAAP